MISDGYQITKDVQGGLPKSRAESTDKLVCPAHSLLEASGGGDVWIQHRGVITADLLPERMTESPSKLLPQLRRQWGPSAEPISISVPLVSGEVCANPGLH